MPSWEAAVAENWLGKWAMNQMLINVSTRKFARSVRLPEGDVPAAAGAGLSKSAASRRFVALSAARMKEWMASDLSGLDLLVIQIDGIHLDDNLILVAAIAGPRLSDTCSASASRTTICLRTLNLTFGSLSPSDYRRRVRVVVDCVGLVQKGDLAMYALIIVIGMLSPATSTVVPVGVTSQIVGSFKNLERCKAAASEAGAGGTISDLGLTRGVYWYCVRACAE